MYRKKSPYRVAVFFLFLPSPSTPTSTFSISHIHSKSMDSLKDSFLRLFLSADKEQEHQSEDVDEMDMFRTSFTPLEYDSPGLFFVLPSDLASWDDTDASTHSLRLYFLCGIAGQHNIPELSHNFHIADHQGYKIKRPQEFLERYGHYALQVLTAFMDKIPSDSRGKQPLDNRVPSPAGSSNTRHGLSNYNLTPLINKAVDYLKNLILPKQSELKPSAADTREIGQYLELQQGDNQFGDFFRIVSSDRTKWMCHTHSHDHLDHQALAELGNFVREQGGHIDVHQGSLNVSLATKKDMHKLVRLLEEGKQVFDISLKMGWGLSEADVTDLAQTFSSIKVVALEVDGVTCDAFPLDHSERTTDIFANLILGDKAHLVRLLNYPRPQEQFIYIGRPEAYAFGFQTVLPAEEPTVQWHTVLGSLNEFKGRVVESAPEAIKTYAKGLPAVLVQHGILDVSAITIESRDHWWISVDLQQGTIPEVKLYDSLFSMDLFKTGTLRQLTLHFIDPETDLDLASIFRANTSVQELCVMTQAHSVFHDIESFHQIREGYPESLLLTLFEQSAGRRRRILAQITMTAGQTTALEPGAQEEKHLRFAGLDFVYWNLDYISAPLTDRAAAVLDHISAQHPKILKSFTLDASFLSHEGLAFVQSILQRSRLEHLQVICSPFPLALSYALTQAFAAVQWLTIKSLTFSGDDIDSWLQHLALQAAMPQLLQVELCGGPSQSVLSHSSVIFLVKLLYPCPLVSLELQNIQLDYRGDLDLISRFMSGDSGLMRAGE